MTRQAYSKKESLNRILRILQGKPVIGDAPGIITGDVMSEDQAMSDIAELIAGSLPNESGFPIPGIFRYGHFYATNITGTVSVASANVYYEVSGSFSSGLLNGVSFTQGMHLSPTYAGRYLISYSMSIRSASANQDVESSLMIAGQMQSGTTSRAELVNANKPDGFSASIILDLAAGSVIGLGVNNRTGGNNVVISHANMSMLLISPYGG